MVIGSAVLAAAFPDVGIGLLGVSLAFGLAEIAHHGFRYWAYIRLPPQPSCRYLAFGRGGRFDAKDVAPYIIAQVLGGIIAGGVLL